MPCSPSSSGVEQRIENPRVGGSNPPSGTIFPVFYIYQRAVITPVAGVGELFVCNGQKKPEQKANPKLGEAPRQSV